MRAPGFDYGGEWVEITEKWIQERIDDYAVMTERGYRSPILREHTPTGEREGDVAMLALEEVGGEPTLVARLDFIDAADAQKMRTGRQKYVSVGLGSIATDVGDVFRDAVLEVSLVGTPHAMTADTHVLRSAQSGRITIGREQMDDDSPGVEEPVVEREEVSLQDFMAAANERMARMEKLLVDRMGDHGGKDRAHEDEPVDEKKKEEEDTGPLVRRIKELERAADWEGFQKRFPAGVHVQVSRKAVKALFECLCAARPEGSALADALVEGVTTKTERGAELVVDQGGLYSRGWAKGIDAGAEFTPMDEESKYQAVLKRCGGDATKAVEEMAKTWSSVEYAKNREAKRGL